MIRLLALIAVITVAFASNADAHILATEHTHASFGAGLTHPMLGLDHILAMVAVGLLAWRMGGRALWALPAAFVGMMGLGFALALTGVALPFVEPAILASVVALGLLIAFAVRLPVASLAVVVGGFAVFHGFAHGAEIGSAGALAYGAGFAVATALLHVMGIGLGFGIAKLQSNGDLLARAMGAGTAAAGVALILA